MIEFLEAKFADLPSQFQQTRTNQRLVSLQQEFRSIFNLPNETLIASTFSPLNDVNAWKAFTSSMWQSLYLAGTFYLSSSYICFTSSLIYENFILPFLQVKSIEMDSSFSVKIKSETAEVWHSLRAYSQSYLALVYFRE